MNKRRLDVDKIERALIRSHRKPIEVQESPFWRSRVMAQVLEESQAGRPASSRGVRPERTIWRFAFAASLAAVLLAAYAVDSGSEAQVMLSELVVTDSPLLDIIMDLGI
jgi:hypothetical protein